VESRSRNRKADKEDFLKFIGNWKAVENQILRTYEFLLMPRESTFCTIPLGIEISVQSWFDHVVKYGHRG
jgi:hypothetical protein